MAVELEPNKKHDVVKRNGSVEPYNQEKLYKVALWGTDGNEAMAQALIEAMDIRIYDRIPIELLYDELIDTAYNMVSRLSPQYDQVCLRLFLQKKYKQLWNMQRDFYPNYSVVLNALRISESIIDVHEHFTEEELTEISNAIEPSRDLRSTYLGMQVFFEKYSLKGIELLQHGYMRMAIQGFIYDKSPERIAKIIERYNHLSLGYYTEATPKFKNSLRAKFQAASCCVHKSDDNTESINKVVSDIGQYSRYDGGNALDISSWRCRGSSIGTRGKSSGPVPFIRKVQASIEAFNQSGDRPGICIVTYPWWHADVMELLPLMDEGGKENQRARNLKFTIKLNRLFLRAIENGEDIHLFDPKDTPELNELYGTAFDEAYTRAIKAGLSKQIISAQELAFRIAEERSNTGNLYIFFVENANENSPFKDIIYSSNACTEIFLSTKAAKFLDHSLQYDMTTQKLTTTTVEATGLTALCNLSAINVDAWYEASPDMKRAIARALLEASDNLIDWQYYPTKDGELFNRNYRAIGIGQSNVAYHFAKNNMSWSSQAAKDRTREIAESIKSYFDEASEQLAIERGVFPWFDRTTHDRPTRFATIYSIAPTSTSSLLIGATEGTEPITKHIIEKTGTYSTKQVAPSLLEYGNNYELSYDIPTRDLYEHASIRQKTYLDQGQSINTYSRGNTKASTIIDDIILAESLGLLSLYYLQTGTVEICESCGA